MDFPLFVGPMQRGREVLSRLAPVKRPEISQQGAPPCPRCSTALSDEIITKMEVNGIEYCPVCVLEDVDPVARPKSLEGVFSKEDVRNLILDTYGPRPDQFEDESDEFPGVYILWSPPREERLDQSLNMAQRLGNVFMSVINAATGNGLLYVGQSVNIARRVWEHIQGGGAGITTIMPPSKLVGVHWKPPNIGLRSLENEVGQQVARSVDQNGYDLEVYWD